MGRTGRKKKPLKHLFSSIAQVAIAHSKHQYHINLKYQREYLGGKRNVRNQVIPILLLLQSTESHLSSGNVFLRVLEILELDVIQPQLVSYPL